MTIEIGNPIIVDEIPTFNEYDLFIARPPKNPINAMLNTGKIWFNLKDFASFQNKGIVATKSSCITILIHNVVVQYPLEATDFWIKIPSNARAIISAMMTAIGHLKKLLRLKFSSMVTKMPIMTMIKIKIYCWMVRTSFRTKALKITANTLRKLNRGVNAEISNKYMPKI